MVFYKGYKFGHVEIGLSLQRRSAMAPRESRDSTAITFSEDGKF
jgi:hypothetical protein